MSKLRSMHRRAFVRALGVGALSGAGLSLTSSLGFDRRARADACPTPRPGAARRFLAFVTPIGFVRDAWATPAMGGASVSLGSSLEPLAPHLDRLLFVKGLDMEASYEGTGGTGHPRGIGALLTGRRLNRGTFDDGVGWASGPSIDQRIAEAIGGDTRLRSIELGVALGNRSSVMNRVSYAGSDRPLASVDDPRVVYDRVFGPLVGDPAAQAARRAEQTSVLDFVRTELDALRGRLGTTARADVDVHLDAIREMERNLDATTLACATPSAPMDLPPQSATLYPALGRAQMDLLVASFACDITRVATLLWSGAVSSQTFTFLPEPIPEGHHVLSHPGANGIALSVALAKQRRIYRWYAQQFAYLLDRLACTPEPSGEGSLLDHTVVFWGTELAHAETHERRNMRFVIAGGDRFFRRRAVVSVDRSHNDLLVSLAQACGVDIDTFGEPAHCRGAATELHR